MDVVWLSLLEALPVGAAVRTFLFCCWKNFTTIFKIVLLPVPGLPVIIRIFSVVDFFTASV